MKRTLFFATLLLSAIALLTTSCGTGDKIGSVSMQVVGAGGAGVVDLKGLGGTLQLQVMANYTSGKQIDETNFAAFTVTPEGTDDGGATLPAPPFGVSLNKTGMLTATAIDSLGDGLCTWQNLGQNIQNPSWFMTGHYTITATYRGFTSNPVYIPVASAASVQSNTNGQCGP